MPTRKLLREPRAMADLHLNLKREYFDAIKDGTKEFEYRLESKWAKRIVGKEFDRIYIKHAYPSRDDSSSILERPWRGFERVTITHPHFGNEPVDVLAIRVN